MIDPRTEDGFRQHVHEERFFIMRQPVYALTEMTPLHDEWLVRFEHDQGLADTIRPAEISGAISTLDLSMLEQAVRTLSADKRRRPIAVNLSGASLSQPHFSDAVFNILDQLRTDPRRLIIELTESWDIRDLSTANTFLQRLRERGHTLCLDDVGAGAASLRYLRAFETEWLKIDGEFFTAAMHNKRERLILENLLQLREGLQVQFIAEGIEDQNALAFARQLGFRAGQGYALGRPEREPIRKRS